MIYKFSKNFVILTVIFIFLTTSAFAQTTKTTSDEKALVIPKVIRVDDVSIKSILKPKGKPLLVNFWATWCVPCREEFPELVEIDKEYKGKIDFITISLDDLAEINRDVPKFLKEMKATMTAYLLKTNDENGVISSISKDWAGGLPFTVLYNEKGEVVHTRQGKIKVDVVKEKINSLFTNNSKTSQLYKARPEYTFEDGVRNAEEDIAKGIFIIKIAGESVIMDFYKDALKELITKNNIIIDEYGCTSGISPEYRKGYNKVSTEEITRRFGAIPVKIF